MKGGRYRGKAAAELGILARQYGPSRHECQRFDARTRMGAKSATSSVAAARTRYFRPVPPGAAARVLGVVVSSRLAAGCRRSEGVGERASHEKRSEQAHAGA